MSDKKEDIFKTYLGSAIAGVFGVYAGVFLLSEISNFFFEYAMQMRPSEGLDFAYLFVSNLILLISFIVVVEFYDYKKYLRSKDPLYRYYFAFVLLVFNLLT